MCPSRDSGASTGLQTPRLIGLCFCQTDFEERPMTRKGLSLQVNSAVLAVSPIHQSFWECRCTLVIGSQRPKQLFPNLIRSWSNCETVWDCTVCALSTCRRSWRISMRKTCNSHKGKSTLEKTHELLTSHKSYFILFCAWAVDLLHFGNTLQV